MGLNNKWDPSIIKWFENNTPGSDCETLRDLIKKELGVDMTVTQIRSLKKNHHIKSDVHRTNYYRLFTDEQVEFIKAVSPGKRSDEIQRLVNERFGTNYKVSQISAMKKNYRITSGYDARFKKGVQAYPENGFKKGTKVGENTWFRKGHTPANSVDVNTIHKRGDLTFIKTNNGNGVKNWELYQRWVWEQNYGKIPEGNVIVFRDNNSENFDPENLAMVTKQEHHMMNKMSIRKTGFDFDIALEAARVALMVNKRKKDIIGKR